VKEVIRCRKNTITLTTVASSNATVSSEQNACTSEGLYHCS